MKEPEDPPRYSEREGGSSGGSVSTQRFPRSARLLTASDYAAVFKKSKRLSDRYWTVLAHSADQIEPRLGLAIAKKRAKRAIDRNRIKRIARESFRHHRSSLTHTELVVMNRDETAHTDSRILRASLDRLLEKLSL
ncbi:MAG: ribonuclease P protein component [Granulosicoccus sp.]